MFLLFSSAFLPQEILGVHAHLSKCWRGGLHGQSLGTPDLQWRFNHKYVEPQRFHQRSPIILPASKKEFTQVIRVRPVHSLKVLQILSNVTCQLPRYPTVNLKAFVCNAKSRQKNLTKVERIFLLCKCWDHWHCYLLTESLQFFFLEKALMTKIKLNCFFPSRLDFVI